jgi:hypothetical protein
MAAWMPFSQRGFSSLCVRPGSQRVELRELAAIIYPPLITSGTTSFAWFFATHQGDKED